MNFLIHHLLDESFAEHPNAVCVRQENMSLRYAELQTLIARFETFLIQSNLKKGDLIGILSRARPETFALMIAALRLGIVYVPLNIHAPVAWIGNISRKSGIKNLFLDPGLAGKGLALQEFGIEKITFLGENDAATAQSFARVLDCSPNESAGPDILADDLAYVLYTSGSTGDPKGILITHRNAVTFITWMGKEFKISSEDKILNRAPLQFDLSVFDIFTTFSKGACLVLAPLRDKDPSPYDVVSLMIQEKISVVYTVPSAYIAWLSKGELARGIPSLRYLLYAGEPFPTPYLRKVMQCLPGTIVSNIYGPTETNIVTYYHVFAPPETDDPTPIGKPVHDTEAYIVDENLRPVPNGEIGEILIRGGTVFAGYLNNAELTRERLVQSPFHKYPTLCCRTGDYGRWLPDGNIAYHGRKDHMVKTRGYRVELNEIEQAISSFKHVDEVAVVPKAHDRLGATLHAFIGSKNENSLEWADLKSYLEEKIPSYMVPWDMKVFRELPKTATGKIDRVYLSTVVKEG